MSRWWRLCGARMQACRENFNGEQQGTCGKTFLSAFTITRYLRNGMFSYIAISHYSTLFDKYREFNAKKFVCPRKAHTCIVSPTIRLSVSITLRYWNDLPKLNHAPSYEFVVHNKCMDHSLEVTANPQFRHPNTRYQTAGSGGVTPLALSACTIWRCVVTFTPRAIYRRRKNSNYSLNKRVGGPKSRSTGEQNNLVPLLGIDPRLLGRLNLYSKW